MAAGIGVERFAGARYREAHLAKVRLKPEAHKILQSWLKSPRHFLIFMGCPGCGKTYTSIAIMRYLWEKANLRGKGDKIFYYPQREIFSHLKDLIAKNWSTEVFLNEISESLLLAIDDFGASRNNEWQSEVLNGIISARYDSEKPTIITTNLDFDEIGRVFHPRTRSRLEASENLIITEWEEDLRKV